MSAGEALVKKEVVVVRARAYDGTLLGRRSCSVATGRWAWLFRKFLYMRGERDTSKRPSRRLRVGIVATALNGGRVTHTLVALASLSFALSLSLSQGRPSRLEQSDEGIWKQRLVVG